MHELLEGLFCRSKTLIVKVSVPNSRIHKVTYRVLGTAYIKVNGHPVTEKLLISKLVVVLRVYITQEIPA